MNLTNRNFDDLKGQVETDRVALFNGTSLVLCHGEVFKNFNSTKLEDIKTYSASLDASAISLEIKKRGNKKITVVPLYCFQDDYSKQSAFANLDAFVNALISNDYANIHSDESNI